MSAIDIAHEEEVPRTKKAERPNIEGLIASIRRYFETPAFADLTIEERNALTPQERVKRGTKLMKANDLEGALDYYALAFRDVPREKLVELGDAFCKRAERIPPAAATGARCEEFLSDVRQAHRLLKEAGDASRLHYLVGVLRDKDPFGNHFAAEMRELSGLPPEQRVA